jgi:hypothetical protein
MKRSGGHRLRQVSNLRQVHPRKQTNPQLHIVDKPYRKHRYFDSSNSKATARFPVGKTAGRVRDEGGGRRGKGHRRQRQTP